VFDFAVFLSLKQLPMFRNLLFLFLMAQIGMTSNLPKDLSDNQKAFILEFVPKIFEANQQVLALRAKTIQIQVAFLKSGKLSVGQKEFVSNLANEYDLKFYNADDVGDTADMNKVFDALLLRIDKIPPKLIMAQAIIESGWGKSYFATEANNYFGIHCYEKGCGLPPKDSPNAKFEVKKYKDIESCILDYMRILNSIPAYSELWTNRAELQKKGEQVNAEELAGALTRYSQKGEAYVTLINNVIKDFLPGDLKTLVDSFKKQ
jgi:Bax protein